MVYRSFPCRALIGFLVLGAFLLGRDERLVRNIYKLDSLQLRSNRTSTTDLLRKGKNDNANQNWSWINTSGVTLSQIHGDPTTCTDVIYTGDTRLPLADLSGEDSFVHASWEGLSYILQTAPALNKTCLVFFKVDSPFFQNGTELHPVWGRLPATALVMNYFPKAGYFLYVDSDAILALPNHTPTDMYQILSYERSDQNDTQNHHQPGLIVNKPMTGWLCSQCEKFGLGHGCFNTGALLWRRSEAAHFILKAWWDSRLHNASQNFKDEEGEYFHGWSSGHNNVEDKMGEQNRLMYLFGTNPIVQQGVWPVPRQKSDEFQSTSCPNDVDAGHTPCLQNDFANHPVWNTTEPSCFVNHYTDNKSALREVLDLILGRTPEDYATTAEPPVISDALEAAPEEQVPPEEENPPELDPPPAGKQSRVALSVNAPLPESG